MECGVRSVACGLWTVMCGAWCVVLGVWYGREIDLRMAPVRVQSSSLFLVLGGICRRSKSTQRLHGRWVGQWG